MSETAPVWKEIAKSAEGEYFAIEQSGGVVAVTTPYDEELAQLGVDLRATNLYYGDREMNMRQQAREELATRNDKAIADRPAAAAERAAYLASGAGGASLGAEQELLRDISEGTVKLVDVKDDELPDVMQSMNESEREAYVKDQLHRREQIALRINDLNAKRTEFMKNELVKNGPVSSFDTSVLEAMRKQAVRAGIEYREETPSPSEKELEKDNGDK